jgi:hypothetical protein
MIRRLAPSLALCSIAALALAACQQPATEPAPAPAPAPEQPAPRPTTPATPAPANVLTAEGLGGMRIGMTLAELTAVAGADSTPNQPGGAEPAVCDEFHPVNAPEGVNVMIQNGRLARITLIRASTIKTDRGFGLGDQASAIKQAYGSGLIAQPHKYSPAPAEDLFAWSRGGSSSYVQDENARGIRYEINTEGRVGMIHAGGPAIQLVEGCS